MGDKKFIPLLTNLEGHISTDEKQLFNVSVKKKLREVMVDAEVLNKNLAAFMSSISEVFINIDYQLGAYKLDEIELGLAISATGGISMIGSAEIQAQASMTLKFKKS